MSGLAASSQERLAGLAPTQEATKHGTCARTLDALVGERHSIQVLSRKMRCGFRWCREACTTVFPRHLPSDLPARRVTRLVSARLERQTAAR